MFEIFRLVDKKNPTTHWSTTAAACSEQPEEDRGEV